MNEYWDPKISNKQKKRLMELVDLQRLTGTGNAHNPEGIAYDENLDDVRDKMRDDKMIREIYLELPKIANKLRELKEAISPIHGVISDFSARIARLQTKLKTFEDDYDKKIRADSGKLDIVTIDHMFKKYLELCEPIETTITDLEKKLYEAKAKEYGLDVKIIDVERTIDVIRDIQKLSEDGKSKWLKN